MYERLKHVFAEANARRRGQRTGELPLLEHGLASSAAAGCSGAFAAVLTTPVDVVKTRIMLAAAYGAETEDVLRKVGGAVIHGHVDEAVGAVKEEVKGVVSGAVDDFLERMACNHVGVMDLQFLSASFDRRSREQATLTRIVQKLTKTKSPRYNFWCSGNK